MTTSKKPLAAAVLAVLVAATGATLALRSPSSTSAAGATTTSAEATGRNDAKGAATASVRARDLGLGRSFTYELSATRTVGDGQGKVATSTKLGGRLVMTVVGEAEGGAAIRAELREATRQDQPALGAEAREALGTPFFFVMRADGAVGSFGFPRTMPGEARRQLRSVVSSLQIVTGAANAWESHESDGTGELVASYVRSGEHLEKTKQRYDVLRTPAGPKTPSSMGGTYEVTGGAKVDLDASGWPSSLVESVSVVATFHNVKMTLAEQTSAKLVAQGESKEHAGSWEASKASFDVDVDALAEGAALARRNADENLVAGASFRALLGDLEGAKDGRAKGKTAARLGALFRTKPEAVVEAREILLAKSTKESTAKSLAAALGNGGTKEAQKALADSLRSADVTPGTKAESAVSLGLVAKPTAEAKSALSEAMGSKNADVAQTAMLALGNLAKADADAQGEAKADDVVPALLAKLDAAQTGAEKAAVLDALGNAGDVRALDAILAHASSPDTVVRAAAVGALRFIQDERATKGLAAGVFDAAPQVRLAAVAGLGTRPVVPVLEIWKHVLAKDEDTQVRLAAVRVLARSVNAAGEVEALLAEVASKDADAKVREAAAQALSKPKAPVER